jgi:hypothetical protein
MMTMTMTMTMTMIPFSSIGRNENYMLIDLPHN